METKANSRPDGSNGISAEVIVAQLRSEIVGGTLMPGAQLPTRVELKERFGTTSVTVQRALDRLMREEFVYANGRRGTYVADSPPHLSRYALIFPTRPSMPHEWRRFWSALSNEAMAIQQGHPTHQLPIYHEVNHHLDGQDYHRLLQDVRTHRVAGLIFASPPQGLTETPLLREATVPRVAIAGASFPQVPTVRLDQEAFCDKAVDSLASQGCRRIALVLPSSLLQCDLELWLEKIGAHGLKTKPHWLQTVHLAAPESARNIVHLLMNPDQRERPDGLIVSDDNLIEHCMAGLIAARVRVPSEVRIVAHCNFPNPISSILPSQRLGFDARSVLRVCLESIDLQRRGEAVAPQVLVEPVFEEETLSNHSLYRNGRKFTALSA